MGRIWIDEKQEGEWVKGCNSWWEQPVQERKTHTHKTRGVDRQLCDEQAVQCKWVSKNWGT